MILSEKLVDESATDCVAIIGSGAEMVEVLLFLELEASWTETIDMTLDPIDKDDVGIMLVFLFRFCWEVVFRLSAEDEERVVMTFEYPTPVDLKGDTVRNCVNADEEYILIKVRHLLTIAISQNSSILRHKLTKVVAFCCH